jgi:hypothetical protein
MDIHGYPSISVHIHAYLGELPNQWFCLQGQTLVSSQIYDFASQGNRNHWFYLPWQAPKSTVLLSGQAKSCILLSFASSQIYNLACPEQNHGLYLPWQAPESMILLARANKICDFTYLDKLPNLWFCLRASSRICDFAHIGKLPNLCFCMPGPAKSVILLTLTSSQIYGVACQGIENHWFCSLWQVPTCMIMLARASKSTDFASLGSS